jgi:hypothetical protein
MFSVGLCSSLLTRIAALRRLEFLSHQGLQFGRLLRMPCGRCWLQVLAADLLTTSRRRRHGLASAATGLALLPHRA